MRYLISRGLSSNGKSCSIFATAWGAQAGSLKILLDAGAWPNWTPQDWGVVLLKAAQVEESAGFVETLLDYGVVATKDIPQKRVLNSAAVAYSQGNLGFVKALLDRGVSIDHEMKLDGLDKIFPPPIVYAKRYDQDHVVRGLLKLGVEDFDLPDNVDVDVDEILARTMSDAIASLTWGTGQWPNREMG